MHFEWRTAAACPLCRKEWFVERASECFVNSSTQNVYHKSVVPCAGGEPPPPPSTRACEVLEVTESVLTQAAMAGIVAAVAVVVLVCYAVAGRRKYREAHKDYMELRATVSKRRVSSIGPGHGGAQGGAIRGGGRGGAEESTFDFGNFDDAVTAADEGEEEEGGGAGGGAAFSIGEDAEDFFEDEDHATINSAQVQVEMTSMETIEPATGAGGGGGVEEEDDEDDDFA